MLMPFLSQGIDVTDPAFCARPGAERFKQVKQGRDLLKWALKNGCIRV